MDAMMKQKLEQLAAARRRLDSDQIRRAGCGSKRTPCSLLIDKSNSMNNSSKMEQANESRREILSDLRADRITYNSCDLAEVGFNECPDVETPFTPVSDYPVQKDLKANGNTHLGEAVLKGVEMIDAQLAAYRRDGILYHCPILWIISDGASYGEDPQLLRAAIAHTTARIREGSLRVYAIAIGEDADIDCLTALAGGAAPLRVGDHEIVQAMHEVSRSIISASRDAEYLLNNTVGLFYGK